VDDERWMQWAVESMVTSLFADGKQKSSDKTPMNIVFSDKQS